MIKLKMANYQGIMDSIFGLRSISRSINFLTQLLFNLDNQSLSIRLEVEPQVGTPIGRYLILSVNFKPETFLFYFLFCIYSGDLNT